MDKANDLSVVNTYEKLIFNSLKNKTSLFDKKKLEKFKLITPGLPYFYNLPKTNKQNMPLTRKLFLLSSPDFNIILTVKSPFFVYYGYTIFFAE